ncbi:MAG: FecR family protein [Cyanobacteria bacterium J06627_8]
MKSRVHWGTVHSLAIGLSVLACGLSFAALPLGAQQLRLPSSQRWLEIQRLQGNVTFRGSETRAAQIGDVLSIRGHGIRTARRALATLTMDTQIGTVRVAESTDLRVRQLDTLPDGARVTVLEVTEGQARFQTRPFTNPNSRLEIRSPSGIAAVRGTEFGVSVSFDGKTSVATESGAVEVSAQGETVIVNPDFGSIIYPGRPPSIPQPIDRTLSLDIDQVQGTINGFDLIARVNPLNSVFIDGQEVPVDPNGRVSEAIAAEENVRIIVRNPLGDERSYTIRWHQGVEHWW